MSDHFEGFDWPEFTMVPNAIFERFIPEMSSAAIKVLLVIVHACLYGNREEGFAPLGYADIIERTGLSRNTMRNALRECIEAGTVVVVEEHDSAAGLSTLYGLHFKAGVDPSKMGRGQKLTGGRVRN